MRSWAKTSSWVFWALVALGCGGGRPSRFDATVGDDPVGDDTVRTAAFSVFVLPQDPGKEQILAALEQAVRHIEVGLYELSDQALIAALLGAAERGVQVDLILDASANTEPLNQLAVNRLSRRGVHVVRPEGVAFYHAKFAIIDATVALVMTCNWSYRSFLGNREVVLVTTDGTVVSQLAAVFDLDFNARKAHIDSPLLVSPDNARERLLGLIKRATRRLWVAMPEITDREVAAALEERAEAGVEVRWLRGAPSSPVASLPSRIFTRGTLHEKVLISDDVVAVGSINLTATSLDRNREIGVLVTGGAAERLESQFNEDWQASTTSRN